jgi:hypothetical protein
VQKRKTLKKVGTNQKEKGKESSARNAKLNMIWFLLESILNNQTGQLNFWKSSTCRKAVAEDYWYSMKHLLLCFVCNFSI